MGGTAKDRNKLADQAQAQAIQRGATGDTRSAQEYAGRTSNRDFVTDQYKNMLSGMDADEAAEGPGGEGRGGVSGPRENQAKGFYRNWMESGGYSPEDIRDQRARAAGTIPSFYSGIQNQMDQTLKQQGLNAGGLYNAQFAKSARDAAKEAESGRLNSEVELQNAIRSGREKGAQGLSQLDESQIGREMSAAAANAGRGAANEQREYENRMGILGRLGSTSYGDEDYMGAGNQSTGQATNAVNSRQEDEGWGSKLVKGLGSIASIAGSAASIAAK